MKSGKQILIPEIDYKRLIKMVGDLPIDLTEKIKKILPSSLIWIYINNILPMIETGTILKCQFSDLEKGRGIEYGSEKARLRRDGR